MSNFSSVSNVGVSPVVPNVTIYSVLFSMIKSITFPKASKSTSMLGLKGVIIATPVPCNCVRKLIVKIFVKLLRTAEFKVKKKF